MKLTSHGCSFVYGSELSSPSLSWPALVAQNLGYDHVCWAVPGSGNLQIMESVLSHADKGDLCMVNWTWIDRFDYVDIQDESWQTLRPIFDHDHAEYYYRHLHGQYRDMLTNLVYISTAINFLKHRGIPFVMTYMDSVLFEQVNPSWHQPDAVTYLQQQVSTNMRNFDGLNFLDWSRINGFEISETWHPLDQAHAAAANYMLPLLMPSLMETDHTYMG
jgi:hypothetical protein